MTIYKYTTPRTLGFNSAPVADSISELTTKLLPFDFEGCAVWKYNKRTQHWDLIFDTSVHQSRLITSAQYWQNVVKNEGA